MSLAVATLSGINITGTNVEEKAKYCSQPSVYAIASKKHVEVLPHYFLFFSQNPLSF